MSALSSLLQSYFTDRLIRQRHASPHTIASYRDTFRLLLKFVKAQTGKTPSKIQLEDSDASLIGAFLAVAGKQTRQQRPHTQRAPYRDPFVLPVRITASA